MRASFLQASFLGGSWLLKLFGLGKNVIAGSMLLKQLPKFGSLHLQKKCFAAKELSQTRIAMEQGTKLLALRH